MYSTHSLPPLAHEHRPLPLTSDTSRPLPAGECRYILLHPSVPNQRCSCQSFHHNRNAPGSICDCGHQACYHVHTPPAPPAAPQTHDPFRLASQSNLADRVRRLEEALNSERQIRDTLLAEERRAREREVRILREALHPFYKSEEEMRRKLVELEDRIDGSYDESFRLKERIVNIDDANMALEKRIDDLEGSRKRRRLSRQPHADSLPSGSASKNGSNPSSSDDKLFSKPAPRRRYSPSLPPPPQSSGAESPRSSGILDLVNIKRSPPPLPTQRPSPPREEPRSSGFLALDLAERFNTKKSFSHPDPQQDVPLSLPPPVSFPNGNDGGQISYPKATEALSIISVLDRQLVHVDHKRSTSVEVMEIGTEDGSPKKRKRDNELMALDVLANVSVASPLA